MYKTPNEFYFRIHHVRPRFKKNPEQVVIFIANEIAKLEEMSTKDFRNELNESIKRFPGNAILKKKTIDNWRTEISSLFGFIQPSVKQGMSKPGLRAIELSEKEDLVEAFKVFLYFFQYPGGHIKPHENIKYIEQGVNFKPAQYILKLMEYAEKHEGIRVGITKAELTHLVFNDLRCTRDNQAVSVVWELIKNNRKNNVTYDWTGDVIRYAGDILDYMEIANLLVSHGNLFYINWLERQAVYKFISSNEWFSLYDRMILNKKPDINLIKECHINWFDYVNQELEKSFFETDILAFISSDIEEYEKIKKISQSLLEKKLEQSDVGLSTKEIGDWGETLVHGHECVRVKIGGREDLVHLIKPIPTQLAVGYDIQSVELDARKRYIEVKTTISSRPIDFNKFHLTPNEWGTAESVKDRYFVYRLHLSKFNKRLFVMQDPVGLYKNDIVRMTPRGGADITFNPEESGHYEELLSWEG